MNIAAVQCCALMGMTILAWGACAAESSPAGISLPARDAATDPPTQPTMPAAESISLLVVPCLAAGEALELSRSDLVREARGVSMLGSANGFDVAYLSGSTVAERVQVKRLDLQANEQSDFTLVHGDVENTGMRLEAPAMAHGTERDAIAFASNASGSTRSVTQTRAPASDVWQAELALSNGLREAHDALLLPRGSSGFVAVWSEQAAPTSEMPQPAKQLYTVRLAVDGTPQGEPAAIDLATAIGGFTLAQSGASAPSALVYVQGGDLWLHAIAADGAVAANRSQVIAARNLVGRPAAVRPNNATGILVAWSESAGAAAAQLHVLQVPDAGAARYSERIVSAPGDRAIDAVLMPFFDIAALAYRGSDAEGSGIRMTMLFATGERLLGIDRVVDAAADSAPLALAMLPNGQQLGLAWTDLPGMTNTVSHFVGVQCTEPL